MNMKVRKSVIAFLMATTMVGSTAVPAMAGQITVKIQATGLQGESSENIDTILSDSLDIADTGSVTAMDVLKELAAPGEGKPVEDIRVIDISNVSVIADYFVIASGSNTNQIQAMVDNVEEEMFKAGFDDPKVEGYNTASWILLDYKDVIVHVFSEDDRAFYNIERIWRDGKEVDINSL